MADVSGRLTGRAGVCLATLGPGATNLVTGVADANLDRAPLVAITGQAGLRRLHKESHQHIDIVESFRPITKWNVRVERGATVPEVVRKAFKVAQTEKPGACHIEFPEDVAGEEAEGEPLRPGNAQRATPDERALRAAVKLIDEARYPLILSGNGVIRGRAAQALRAFAHHAQIPVAETFMGKGALSWEDDLSLLTIGLQSKDYVSCGFDRADVIIAVGYDLVEYDPEFWNPDGRKRILHIDSTPSEVDAHYMPDIELTGDIAETLDALRHIINSPKEFHYSRTLRDYIFTELEENAHSQRFPLTPQRVIHEVRKALAPDDILISDVGAHKLWVARLYRTYEPNTVIISNGFCSMGIALPGAVAAKLLYPERRVLALMGDGGFLMNAQELETACRLKLSLVALIMNDGEYGMISWKQIRYFGRKSGVAFSNPDFIKFSEAFGARGIEVRGAEELAPALREALASSMPAIVSVPVDYSENLRLTERMGKLVCPV